MRETCVFAVAPSVSVVGVPVCISPSLACALIPPFHSLIVKCCAFVLLTSDVVTAVIRRTATAPPPPSLRDTSSARFLSMLTYHLLSIFFIHVCVRAWAFSFSSPLSRYTFQGAAALHVLVQCLCLPLSLPLSTPAERVSVCVSVRRCVGYKQAKHRKWKARRLRSCSVSVLFCLLFFGPSCCFGACLRLSLCVCVERPFFCSLPLLCSPSLPLPLPYSLSFHVMLASTTSSPPTRCQLRGRTPCLYVSVVCVCVCRF